MVKRYLGKISQPLLDRFDICIEALQMNYRELQAQEKQETSGVIRECVSRARNIQLERYLGQNIYFNSQLTPKHIEEIAALTKLPLDLLMEQLLVLELHGLVRQPMKNYYCISL